MRKLAVYEELRKNLQAFVISHNLREEKVIVRGRVLSTEEAIGKPQRQDYPLMKGKEKLLQAEFKGSKGQAFTDSPGSFSGSVQELINIPLDTNFNRAAFIATLNAVMRYLGLVEGTIHCKDEEPHLCAQRLVEHLERKYKMHKISMIGLQPALLEYCSKRFRVRVVDMDPDNIGSIKHGVLVEEAAVKTKELEEWCDIMLITGSTVANGTIVDFLQVKKPVVYYGTTIAGAAQILGLKRFCACAK